MTKMESEKYCKELVKKFVEDNCNGQIKNLLEFNMSKVGDNTQFGKPGDYAPGWVMDPDDCIIVRAVLFLLYSEDIEDLTFDMIGKDYRGDTIFTPGNIFGKEYKFLESQQIAKKDIYKEKAKKFLAEYHTIPNMMLLPNKGIIIKRPGEELVESLNRYRGLNDHDYVDLFVEKICAALEPDNKLWEGDENIVKLVRENSFYFGKYEGNSKEFLNSHFLDDLMCDGRIIDEYTFAHVYYWKKTDNYAGEIDKFIKAYERLWTYRKEKMLEKLQRRLA